MRFYILFTFATCLVSVFITVTGFPAIAFEEATELDTVVISASRWEEPAEKVTDRVTVITKEEIEKLPARDATETLEYTPGVTLERGGGGGATSYTFLSVQGAEPYQTTVLLNGIPLNGLGEGVGNVGFLPAGVIERIEVVHGAGGVEWGSAQGGVINVILSKPNQERKNFVTAGGGSDGRALAEAGVQFFSENFSLLAGAGAMKSDGEDETRGYNNTSGLVNLETVLGESSLFNLLAYSFQGDVNHGEYRDALENYWETGVYNVTGVGATFETEMGPGTLKLTGYYQNQNNDVEQKMLNPDELLFTAESKETVTGLSAIFHSKLDWARVTLGAEVESGTIDTNTLDKEKYDVGSNGAFVNVGKDIGDITVQAGVRLSNEDEFGSFTGFNVGALYKFTAPVILRASVAGGYSTPPWNWRFLDIPSYIVANPDLVVEKSVSIQLGVFATLAEGLTIDVNGFQSKVTDALGLATNDEELLYYDNFEEFERSGVEAEIRYVKGVFNLFANTLNQEIKNSVTDEVVKNKIRASNSFGVGYMEERISAILTGTWRDWNTDEDRKAEDKKWSLNAKAGYTTTVGDNQLRVSVAAYNITGVELYTHYMLPMNTGAEYEATVQYLF